MSKLVFGGETLITATELDAKGYQDSSAVAGAIASAVDGLATDASVASAIETAVNGLATDASVDEKFGSLTIAQIIDNQTVHHSDSSTVVTQRETVYIPTDGTAEFEVVTENENQYLKVTGDSSVASEGHVLIQPGSSYNGTTQSPSNGELPVYNFNNSETYPWIVSFWNEVNSNPGASGTIQYKVTGEVWDWENTDPETGEATRININETRTWMTWTSSYDSESGKYTITYTPAEGVTLLGTIEPDYYNISAPVSVFGIDASAAYYNGSGEMNTVVAMGSGDVNLFYLAGIEGGYGNICMKTTVINEYDTNEYTETNNAMIDQRAGAVAETVVTSKGYQTAAQVNTAITGKGYQNASQVATIATSKANEAVKDVTGVGGEVIVTGDVFIPAKDAVPSVQADYTSGTPGVRYINETTEKNYAKRLGLQAISYLLLKNFSTIANAWTVNLGSANYVDKPITEISGFLSYDIFILGWSDENHTQRICGGSYQYAGYGQRAFCYKLNNNGTDLESIWPGSGSKVPSVTLTPNFTTGDKVWDKWYPLLKPKAGMNISWTATITDGSTVFKIYDVIMAIHYTRKSGGDISNTYQPVNQTLPNMFLAYATSYQDVLCPADMKAYSFSDNQLVHAYEQGLDSYKEEMDAKLSMFNDVSLYDGKESIADPSISFVTYSDPYDDAHRTKLADHVASDASIAVVTVKWEDPYDEMETPRAFSFFNDGGDPSSTWNANELNNTQWGHGSPDAILKIDGWNYVVNCHIPVEDPNNAGFYSYAGSYEYYKDSNTHTQLQYHIGEIALTTKNEYDDLVQTVDSITNAGYQTASDVSTAISTAMSSALHMVTLTQEQYDALQEKAPNTLYIISD